MERRNRADHGWRSTATAQEIAEHEIVHAQECGEWLRDLLLDGPKPSTDVFKASIDAGYTRDQVRGAKHRIELLPKARFSDGPQWTWELLTEASN